jgi:hypothetical protein
MTTRSPAGLATPTAEPLPAPGVEEIRRLIARHRTWDWLFGILGVFALMFAVLVFATLFGQMLQNGLPHLSWDFFTSFPSRRAASAGILSAWVGHGSGHAGDGAGGRAARRRRRHLPRRIRAEEPAHRHHRDQRDQPRRRAVDHLRPAGARLVRLPVRPRPEHRRRRPDARPPDPAGGHRRHPRGDSHHPAEHPRSGLCLRRHQAGRSSRSTSSPIRCRES